MSAPGSDAELAFGEPVFSDPARLRASSSSGWVRVGQIVASSVTERYDQP